MDADKEFDACIACTDKCFKEHKNVNGFKFYKVMTKETMLNLDLPKIYMDNFSTFSGIHARLKGPTGRSWTASVHYNQNQLHLKHGWPSFVAENLLHDGDITVFRCIGTLSFLVQVFSQDGIEKLGISSVDKSNPFLTINGSLHKVAKSNNCGKAIKLEACHSENMSSKISNSNKDGNLFSSRSPKPCSTSRNLRTSQKKNTKVINRSNSKQSLLTPKAERIEGNVSHYPKDSLGSSSHPIVIDDEEKVKPKSSPVITDVGKKEGSCHFDCNAYQERVVFCNKYYGS